MATLLQRHCSDECLIAHLDGELPFYRRLLVRRHLASCWQCRLRLSEIEKQVFQVTHGMEEDSFPGPQGIVDARLRFQRAADQIAAEVATSRPGQSRPAWGWRLGWATACLLALAGSWYWLREPARQPAIAATAVLARSKSAEAEVTRGSVRQEFRVVARQVRPQPLSAESRLEVWSEPEQGRFALRLTNSEGVLQQAVWRPVSNRSYVYNPRRGEKVERWSGQQARDRWSEILLREDLTLTELEAGLITWIEERPWQPISLSSGVALMAAGDGAVLKAELARSASGDEVVRLSARRSSGKVSAAFVIEVDRSTYLPRLQCIRYESPARTLELWLYPEKVRVARIVSFEPPAITGTALPLLPLDREPRVPQATLLPPKATDPVLLEIEAYYALHRVRACLGEAVEVARRPDGGLTVRGVVVDSDRKEQLAAALSPLSGPMLSVEIKSVQEAISDIGPSRPEPVSPAFAPASVRKEAIQLLAEHFSKDEIAAARFVEKALSESDDLIFEAQALRQLAGLLHSEREMASPRARWLTQVMIYDHLSDFQARLESAWQLVRPPLAAAAGPGFVLRSDFPAGEGGRGAAEFDEIFKLARRLSDRLRALLLGGGAGQPSERLARDVLEAFPPLQATARRASDDAMAAYAETR